MVVLINEVKLINGQCHRRYFVQNYGSVWQNRNGNRNVGYLNFNDGQRKLNLNWIDNDWNDICRFAAVRQFLFI